MSGQAHVRPPRHELPPADERGIHWFERTTKQGTRFRHGFKPKHPLDQKKFDAIVERKRAVEPEHGPPVEDGQGAVAVYWPVGDRSWKGVQPNVRQNGISRYSLFAIDEPVYTYELDFTNTGYWGFTFYDQTGDDYNCSTVLNGDHYIQYNSSEPTITSFSHW